MRLRMIHACVGSYMASVAKHGERWRAQVFKKGVRESKIFATKSQATRWAARREYEIEHAGEAASKALFRDVLERYTHEVSPKKRGVRWERIKAKNLGCDKIGAMQIGQIKPSDIADWRDRRLKEVQPATVNREMNLLSHVFQTARKEWGLIDRSPMTDVARPKGAKPRSRVATEHELQAMRLVAGPGHSSMTSRAYWAFMFACETAMRAGEIVGLSSKAVDYGSRVAHLSETKNGDPRDVPLSSEAVRILQALPDQERLFNMTPSQLSSAFMRLTKKAGVDGLTFHDSRRIGTTMLSKKLEVLDLARVTGHKDIRVLLEVYYKPDAAAMARMLD